MFKLYKQIQLLTAAGKGVSAFVPNSMRGVINVAANRNYSNGKRYIILELFH